MPFTATCLRERSATWSRADAQGSAHYQCLTPKVDALPQRRARFEAWQRGNVSAHGRSRAHRQRRLGRNLPLHQLRIRIGHAVYHPPATVPELPGASGMGGPNRGRQRPRSLSGSEVSHACMALDRSHCGSRSASVRRVRISSPRLLTEVRKAVAGERTTGHRLPWRTPTEGESHFEALGHVAFGVGGEPAPCLD